jgi:hypothetical protein
MSYLATTDSSLNMESFTTGEVSADEEDTVEDSTRLYEINKFPDYHDTEKEIREKNKMKMNVFYVKGEKGTPVGINMEKTQNLPTYYQPGDFMYKASTYVPSYEDSIHLASASTAT